MNFAQAAQAIKEANRVTAFSGAGISVESGIPPFRGENGLWNKYDPTFLDLSYFYQNPTESWKLIKEIFYDFMGKVDPNRAHTALAEMEQMGYVHATITQNIDNLHQKAGSNTVYEYHGNSRELTCMECRKKHRIEEISWQSMPPRCFSCQGILKPDFIFFGEGIPEPAGSLSHKEAYNSDLFLVIGTTGEIMPAALIPMEAKRNGATIIEINIQPSHYTHAITDTFVQGKATEMMDGLLQAVKGS